MPRQGNSFLIQPASHRQDKDQTAELLSIEIKIVAVGPSKDLARTRPCELRTDTKSQTKTALGLIW